MNPSRWIQIGGDQDRHVWGGRLGQWDAEAQSGLYTLQFLVVMGDGEIWTASLSVTIDNLAPQVRTLHPSEDFEYTSSKLIQLDAAVEEGIGLEVVQISGAGRIIVRLL